MPAERVGAAEPGRAGGFAGLRAAGGHAGHLVTVLASRPRLVLPGLVVAHWLFVLAFALTVRHNGWLYYQGGDQIWYSTTGWLLGHGDLPITRVGYAWSVILAPIQLLFGPAFVPALPAVILLNVLVLGPLALFAVYGIANRLAGRLFALWASALWVAGPYLTIDLWRQDYHERFVEQFLPQALGLGALADYPSMVLLLCASYFVVRALQPHSRWHDPALAGLLTGLAMGMKPANALFLAGPVLAFALARSVRPLLVLGAAIAPALLTLALWKQRGLGDLPLFAHEELRLAAGSVVGVEVDLGKYIDVDFGQLRIAGAELREWFWSARLLEWAPIAGVVAIARRSMPVAALLAGWFGAFLVVKGTSPFATVSSGSFFRMLMPAYPAYFLLAVSIPLLVPRLAGTLASRFPAVPEARFGRRAVFVAAAVLAAVPLAVTLLARPTNGPEEAIVVRGILTPVDDLGLQVRADGEARDLTWETPHGDSDVFYRVFRSKDDGADTSCEGAGAQECELEMVTLGTTRSGRWRDPSPPENATYRVGRAANWRDDPAGGDVYLISPPGR